MNMSESIKELAAALSAAQAELKPAHMNAVNPFLKNRYADLGAVIEAARPVLEDNGLAVSQLVNGDGDGIGVTTVLMHASGEWISASASLPLGEEKGKSSAQVAGSIISYLRRYSLASILGIYADEDVDGNVVATAQAKPAKKPNPQPQPEPAADRPYAPEVLRERIGNVASGTTKKANDQQRKILASALDGIFDGNAEKRHTISKYLTGASSTKDMSDGAVHAMLKWLDVDAFNQPPAKVSMEEARDVLKMIEGA
jgi:hypothetical protein